MSSHLRRFARMPVAALFSVKIGQHAQQQAMEMRLNIAMPTIMNRIEFVCALQHPAIYVCTTLKRCEQFKAETTAIDPILSRV